MIFLGIVLSIAAIGFFCWLLFTLAVFALPFFAGVTAGTSAYHAGVGWLGAIISGVIGAALMLRLGQVLLRIVGPLWARLLIALVFVAPAAVAGYHATHGIVKHTVPSENWQLVFSVIGAIAVGVTAFVRVAGMAATSPTGKALRKLDWSAGGAIARTRTALPIRPPHDVVRGEAACTDHAEARAIVRLVGQL